MHVWVPHHVSGIRYPGIQVSRYPGIQISRYPVTKIHNPEIDDLVVNKCSNSNFEFSVHRSKFIYMFNALTFQSASIQPAPVKHVSGIIRETHTKQIQKHIMNQVFEMCGWNSEMQVVFAYPLPSIPAHFQPILIEKLTNPPGINPKSIKSSGCRLIFSFHSFKP